MGLPASVFVSGGTLSYQYQWNDPASQTVQKAINLSAGNYNVIVTDFNGCSTQAAITVTSPPEMFLNFTNVSGEICAGDCLGQASVNATGGVGGYQFDWDDNTIPAGTQMATNLCPGNYRLTVSDVNGCIEVDSVVIDAATPIVVQLNGTPPSCSGLQDGSINSQKFRRQYAIPISME